MKTLGAIVALIVSWTVAIVIVCVCWWTATSVLDWAF